MTPTKIEWCDETWNPVTGCKHTCEYCYARRIVARFSPDASAVRAAAHYVGIGKNGLYDIADPWSYDGRTLAYPFGFEPTLHRYRLGEPARKRKPRNIFVGSMTDLFGEWVPVEWIKAVFDACREAPHHNYMFLTKNPARYERLRPFHSSNWWFGTSVTRAEEKQRIQYLPFGGPINKANTFLSVEPLLSDLGELDLTRVNWVIVGAETGNRKNKVTPERVWVEKIVTDCRAANVPVFMKDSLAAVWGPELMQEFPPELKREVRA